MSARRNSRHTPARSQIEFGNEQGGQRAGGGRERAGVNNSALQESVRLLDPLQRMRRERWVTFLVFNGLLLAAVLMLFLGHAVFWTDVSMPLESPPVFMEKIIDATSLSR